MDPLPNIDRVNQVNVSDLHAYLTEHSSNLPLDLVKLAELETPSDDLGLLDTAADYVNQWVFDRIGPANDINWHRSSDYGPVLVLDYPGDTDLQIVGLGHFDTVFPEGTLASWPVTTEGDRLSGPGVFDMKAGLVQMVWAIKALDATKTRRPSVRLVLNSDEEIGSHFSRPLIEDAVRGTSAVLVFEGSARHGAIKTARKGVGLFTVTAEGIESHAGLDPESGVSAIDEIARTIRQLHEGADLSKGTSINVGVVTGGTRANVMAGTAVAHIDVRVAVVEERQRVDELLTSLTGHHPEARIRVSGNWNRPIMARTDHNIRMYGLACAVAKRMGITLSEASVGGASDGNFVAALGIPVLDGLGGVGSGAHARHENVSVSALVERATLASGVMAAFAV